MKSGWRTRTLMFIGLATSGLDLACAQVPADRPVASAEPVRRSRLERNRYFAARPVYPPTERGARANVTFEPFTRWYYPNEGTYYPPLDEFPAIRSR